jgi:hypothetical protein
MDVTNAMSVFVIGLVAGCVAAAVAAVDAAGYVAAGNLFAQPLFGHCVSVSPLKNRQSSRPSSLSLASTDWMFKAARVAVATAALQVKFANSHSNWKTGRET